MKISPMIQGTAPANMNEGASAGADRMARAKAVASGQDPTTVQADPQVEQIQNSLKRIKLKTQVSPDRHMLPTEGALETQGDTSALVEPTDTVKEDTKPLSPQFAALAKQKRMLQLKEQELLAKEKAIGTQTQTKDGLEEYRSRIKANALQVLMEEGVTYDQLTEQILSTNQGSVETSALKTEIQAIKEALENQNKALLERDAQTERQARTQILRDAKNLVAQGEEFEMIREAGYAPKVEELIFRTFKQTGELMDVTEAANLIEQELLEDSLKWAKIKKVQSRLQPPAAPQQTQPGQDRAGVKTMRTLTNRDGVSSNSMDRRARAIAAMQGRLK